MKERQDAHMSAVSRRTFSIPFLGYPSSQSKVAGIDIPLHCFGTQKIDQLIRERHWPTSDTHAVLPSNLPSNTGPTTHSQRTSINGDMMLHNIQWALNKISSLSASTAFRATNANLELWRAHASNIFIYYLPQRRESFGAPLLRDTSKRQILAVAALFP